MEINLKGKRALVCGSTQGIGLAIAEEMAKAGAELILFARNEEKLSSLTEKLDQSNGQHHKYIVADFSTPEDVHHSLVDFLKQNGAIEILVNNTGGPAAGQAVDANIKDFRIAFNQHLINNQILVQELLPGMKDSGYGRIINIISTSVKTPIPGLGVSNTIRGAVASWAKTISNELGPFGITVNNILPGLTQTNRLESLIEKKADDAGVSQAEMKKNMQNGIPLRRFADPHELANLAVFLASPLASYITGTSIRVDGGNTPSI